MHVDFTTSLFSLCWRVDETISGRSSISKLKGVNVCVWGSLMRVFVYLITISIFTYVYLRILSIYRLPERLF